MIKNYKHVVNAFFSAAEKNDTENMLSVFDPDVKIIEAQSLPFGGVVQGADNFQSFTKSVFTTWRNTSVVVDQLIADGQHVVVLARMSGESKISGTHFEMEISELWTFNSSGKVKEIKPFYFDTKKIVDLYNGDI